MFNTIKERALDVAKDGVELYCYATSNVITYCLISAAVGLILGLGIMYLIKKK